MCCPVPGHHPLPAGGTWVHRGSIRLLAHLHSPIMSPGENAHTRVGKTQLLRLRGPGHICWLGQWPRVLTGNVLSGLWDPISPRTEDLGGLEDTLLGAGSCPKQAPHSPHTCSSAPPFQTQSWFPHYSPPQWSRVTGKRNPPTPEWFQLRTLVAGSQESL